MCMYSCRCPLQLHLHICTYKTVGVFYNCMCTPVFIKLSIWFSRSCRDVVNYIVIIRWQCWHCRYVDDDDVDDEDDICSKPLFGRNPSQVLSGDPNFHPAIFGANSHGMWWFPLDTPLKSGYYSHIMKIILDQWTLGLIEISQPPSSDGIYGVSLPIKPPAYGQKSIH